MTSGPIAEIIARVLSAREQRQATKKSVQRERSKLTELELTHQVRGQEWESLRRANLHASAQALLDGKDPPAEVAETAKKMADLAIEEPARVVAIRMQQARLTEAETHAKLAGDPYATAVLELASALQDTAAVEASNTIAAMMSPLAHLIAADQIRVSLLGDRHRVPQSAPRVLSGTTVARNFLKAVAWRFRQSW